MIKVLIVDDHELVRAGLKQLLNDTSDIKVIDECDNGEEAVNKAKELHPNIVLMDINMPGLGGMEATRKILRFSPQTKVIVVSVIDTEPFPSRLLELGASGYISKDSTPDELRQAVRRVHAGELYLGPKIAQRVALRHITTGTDSPFASLSRRELQVMQMIIKGLKAPEIAKMLHISPKTINSYRYRLFDKLSINSDVELTHKAIQYGVLTLEEMPANSNEPDDEPNVTSANDEKIASIVAEGA